MVSKPPMRRQAEQVVIAGLRKNVKGWETFWVLCGGLVVVDCEV